MRTKFAVATLALMVASAPPIAAMADSCSGHSHTTGTVLGAVGGGLIGGAITHGNILGVAGGAAAGGLTGNAIARSEDCRHGYYSHRYRHRYWSERYHRYVYARG